MRTTAEMLDQFSRLFQRTLRRLNDHRPGPFSLRDRRAKWLGLA